MFYAGQVSYINMLTRPYWTPTYNLIIKVSSH